MGFVCTTLTCNSEEKLFLSLSCSCESPEGGLECLWRNLSYLLLKMEQINPRKMPGLACKVGVSVCRKRWQSRDCNQPVPAACQLQSPFIESSSPAWKKSQGVVTAFRKAGKTKKGELHRAPVWTNCVWGKKWGKANLQLSASSPLPSLF